ncbi:MAG: serine/threonine protein kinase [Myxococcales bacterium]|nr:serine/threonine protein kinase [Myxococcales bacterium]
MGEGRFEIVGIIGRGAMASVFRARDHRRNADVALKVISRKYVGHHDRERRFENEARLGGRLQGHRNVVAPLEAGRLEDRGGRMFLTMELVRGPTLADLVAMHGPLQVEDACLYLRDVARALRDLHQGGVVHRDVKPENVVVVNTAQGRVAKLLDFGLAADVGSGANDRQTRLGERPGTRHYMSPEQAWDAPAHPVFDIYALGVTFYELLTGHPPFFELDDAEVIARKCDLSLPVPSIKGRRQDMPERLEILVDSCLEPVAKKRLPSINAFLKRLDSVMEEFGGISPRARQQTSMVGQARTIEPARRKKSRLPELMAQAKARKQQPEFVGGANIASDSPTPDPDRVVSRRAVNRAVEGLAQSATALGGQPAHVPHLQPTAPAPQAMPPQGVPPQPGVHPHHHQPHPHQPHQPAVHPSAHQAPHQTAHPSAHQAPHPSAHPSAHPAAHQAPHPAAHQAVPQAHQPAPGPVFPPSGSSPTFPSTHARSSTSIPQRPVRPLPRRRPPPNRAILLGLIAGAVLSALLVVGLWLWLQMRTG